MAASEVLSSFTYSGPSIVRPTSREESASGPTRGNEYNDISSLNKMICTKMHVSGCCHSRENDQGEESRVESHDRREAGNGGIGERLGDEHTTDADARDDV